MQVAKVFISYVKEDSTIVNKLVDQLNAHGIDTWVDKSSLAPGARWKTSIRHAIEDGDFFIACFSESYNNRAKTYMNEELTFAIEQLRLRPMSRIWFIPVKITECEIPDREIGAGETLNSFHYVELFRNWNDGIKKIVRAILPDYRFNDSKADYPNLLKQFPAIPVNIALDIIFEIIVNPRSNREIIAVKGAGGIGKTYFAHELMKKILKLKLTSIRCALIDHFHLGSRYPVGLCKTVQKEIDPTNAYFKDFSKNFQNLEKAQAAGESSLFTKELLNKCLRSFFEEFNTMTQSNRIVLFFDTFEIMRSRWGEESTNLAEWFNSLFQMSNVKLFFLYRPRENGDEIDTFLQNGSSNFSISLIEYQIQTLSWSSALSVLADREVALSNDEANKLFKLSDNNSLVFSMAVEYIKVHGKEAVLERDSNNSNEIVQDMVSAFKPTRNEILTPPKVKKNQKNG